jgi:hypothetical protein
MPSIVVRPASVRNFRFAACNLTAFARNPFAAPAANLQPTHPHKLK